MIRRLFTVAYAMSLLLCVATVVVWARSYWVIDEWSRDAARSPHPNPHPSTSLLPDIIDWHSTAICISLPGAVDLTAWYETDIESWGAGLPNTGWERTTDSAAGSQQTWKDYWFEFSYWRDRNGSTLHVHLPHWAIAVLTGGTAVLIRRKRLARRTEVGVCPCCGYDLRASAGRCPECGKPIPSPAEATA